LGAFVARAFAGHAFLSQVQRVTGLHPVGMEERKTPLTSSLPAKNQLLHFHSCRFRHGRTEETWQDKTGQKKDSSTMQEEGSTSDHVLTRQRR
jgi:hypothetical protein